jgi:hypothetical protein
MSDDKFYGGLRVGAAGASAPTGSGAATPPLTSARTIHVDSALGNDATGNGSAALPYATLARAWTERLTYGELRAKLVVQLHGVGPYTMPVMGASVCGDGGYFQVYGDPAVDIAVASGTFTGDLNTTTYTLPTSAGLGVNTLKNAFLEITSGGCAGVRSNIVLNTDTSITIPLRAWRASIAAAVANGDTFRVFQPGTVINVPTPAAGVAYPGCYDWVGSAESVTGYSSGGAARHGFYNVQFTGARMITRAAAVQLIGVRATLSILWFDRSHIVANGPSNGAAWGVGVSAITDLISSYGLIDTASTFIIGNRTIIAGVLCVKTSLNIGSEIAGEGDILLQRGGRFEGGITLTGGTFESNGGGTSYTYIQGALLFSKGAKGYLFTGSGTTSKMVFALTVGSCVDLSDNSLVNIINTSGLSGGTTDAAGFGIRVRAGGGRVLVNGAFTLTGGTLNADVKTAVAAAQANAFFTAANIFITDMGGADLVARV